MVVTPKRRLCADHFHRRQTPVALLLLAEAAVVAAALAALTERPVGATLAWFVPAAVLVVSLQVLAFVVAGLAVRLRTGLVTVGTGPRLATFGRLPHRLVVRLVPVQGTVEAAPRGDPRRPLARLAFTAFAAAGLATDVALLAVAASRRSPFWIAVTAFVAFQLFCIVVGLAGRKGRAGNPLWVVLTRPFGRLPDLQCRPAMWGRTVSELWADFEDVRLVPDHRYDRVAPQIERLAGALPDEPWLRLAQVHALTAARRYDEARVAALAMVDGASGSQLMSLRNLVAWSDAMTGTRPDEMRAQIDLALADAPDNPSVVGTAALVAAREGRLDEAVALCDRAEPGLTVEWQRATVVATRAYVARLRGDSAAERSYAEAARALDPECEVLDLIG